MKRKDIIALAATAALFAAAFACHKLLPEALWYVPLTLYLAAFAVCGLPVLIKAVRGIARGNVFSEDTLMMTAAIGAFIIGEYPEAVFVVFFSRVGGMFEDYAARKSRASLSDVMNIVPDSATLITDGKTEQVDPDEIEIGSLISVAAGERVPLDGVVVKGSSFLDTSALTGESVPRAVREGDEILSGCINKNAVLTVRTTKAFEDSTVSRVLELVENATARKSRSERFITKFARYYTPVVMALALAVAVIPPLAAGPSGELFKQYIYRALSFLVVSCPCALVISVPLSFFGGIGGAAKQGILVKGGVYLEALDRAGTVVFDKTGTLTKGDFAVTSVNPADGFTSDELLRLTAYAESSSSHPIAQSVREAYGKDIDVTVISDTEEVPGKGIRALVDGRRVCAGNAKLMRDEGIAFEASDGGTVVYASADGIFAGYIVISDEIKPGAKELVKDLRAAGIKRTVMLTGDRSQAAEAVAGEIGIDTVYSSLLPDGKVSRLEELIEEDHSGNATTVYVGDGINDAPVLALSDVGVAMGALGSDAAVEAADIVIMNDDPGRIVTAKKLARKTMSIARENIIFSIAAKLLILILCAAGAAGMEWAVFGDTGVMVICVLNAFRALKAESQTGRKDLNS